MLVEQLKENYFFAVIRGKDKEDAKNIARYEIGRASCRERV